MGTYHFIMAWNNRQLLIALRVLHAYGIKQSSVISLIDEREKMHFEVHYGDVDDETATRIQEDFNVMIS